MYLGKCVHNRVRACVRAWHSCVCLRVHSRLSNMLFHDVPQASIYDQNCDDPLCQKHTIQLMKGIDHLMNSRHYNYGPIEIDASRSTRHRQPDMHVHWSPFPTILKRSRSMTCLATSEYTRKKFLIQKRSWRQDVAITTGTIQRRL